MTAGFGAIRAMPLVRGRVGRVSTLSTYVVFFTLAGLTCAWLTNITYAETVPLEVMRTGGTTAELENKSALYYLLHGGEVACVLLAGLLGAAQGGYARLDRLGRLALWVLVLSSIVWALVTYSSSEILSKTIFEATGPFVWLSTLLVLAGTERSLWPSLRRLVNVLMVPTVLLAVHCLLQSHYMGTGAVWRKMNIYFLLLLWYGGWSCLARTRRSTVTILADVALIALLGVMTLSMARRSWTIVMILFTGMYAKTIFEQCKTVRGRSVARRVVFTTVLLPLLIGGLAAAPRLRGSVAALRDRLFQDTRTGQYEIFFSQVPPRALVLGLGPKATYYYGPGARSEYRNFDNGFLWMAFIGGLPILVSYCVLVIRPGLVALLRRGNDWQSAASAKLLFIWTLALGGLGVYCSPSLSAYSYLILLMAGSCYVPRGWPVRRGSPVARPTGGVLGHRQLGNVGLANLWR